MNALEQYWSESLTASVRKDYATGNYQVVGTGPAADKAREAQEESLQEWIHQLEQGW